MILSTGTASNPSGIVFDSSNIIGGGAGNIISANHSYGMHIVGVGATRNLVEGNYIGVAPGGGFLFGQRAPGNLADGVRIDNAPDNQIGGPTATVGNVISANQGNGVYIDGATRWATQSPTILSASPPMACPLWATIRLGWLTIRLWQ